MYFSVISFFIAVCHIIMQLLHLVIINELVSSVNSMGNKRPFSGFADDSQQHPKGFSQLPKALSITNAELLCSCSGRLCAMAVQILASVLYTPSLPILCYSHSPSFTPSNCTTESRPETWSPALQNSMKSSQRTPFRLIACSESDGIFLPMLFFNLVSADGNKNLNYALLQVQIFLSKNLKECGQKLLKVTHLQT